MASQEALRVERERERMKVNEIAATTSKKQERSDDGAAREEGRVNYPSRKVQM